MKKLNTLILIFLSLLSTQCCKDDDNYQLGDQSFVDQATSSNLFEIAAGNLAINKGIREDVRMYGRHMVDEHTAVGIELANLIQSKGLIMPTDLYVKDQVNLDLLNKASAAEFDKEFARIMVESHMAAIDLFTAASGNEGVKDGDLRNFAKNKLPALQSHLASALTLQK